MFSKYSVKKPYTVLVGVVMIIILGVVSFQSMVIDLFPSMNMPYAIVMTTYMGASPEEVELTVTKAVEQSMATVSNIKNITSTSKENASTVMLEFNQTANMDSAMVEMREKLDQAKSYWPDEVGSPIIMKLNPDMMPVLISAVSTDGASAAEVSKAIEDKVVPELESVEGVASVTAIGSIDETVEVTLNEKEIDDLSDEIKDELEKKVNDAKSALNKAKKQMEAGKKKLETGKEKAAEGLAQAETKVSTGAEELKQAQLEITEKEAELSVAQTQMTQSLATIQAAEQKMEAQIQEQTAVKADLEAKIAEETDPIQLEQLKQQMAVCEQALQTMQKSLEESRAQEAMLNEKQAQIDAGKSQLDATKQQVNAGAMSLAEARGQLTSAQLEAAVGISQGNAQIAAGESAMRIQEQQIKSAAEEAKNSVDVDNMLSASMVKTILNAQNFSMPAGYVTEDGVDYLVRVGDKFETIDDLKNLVILDMDGIDPIKLSDVATVKLVNNADETYASINGKQGVMLSIQKQTDYSTRDVTSRVLKKMDSLQKEVDGMKSATLMDQGVYIDMIVNAVMNNLLYGAILAILILLVFLKSIRPTIVIACSIPISLVTAVVAMYFSGVTLNIISLSGLALGVGMLVDNSIVVIENIYRMRGEGVGAKESAIEGARQVSGAIFASTMTTICVFLPIVFTEGITRQLFVDMGLTIAYSLLASLLVALTLVPAMSAGLLKNSLPKESRFFAFVRKIYGKILAVALKFKIVVVLAALLLFAGSVKLAASNGTEFMANMESTQISVTLETPKETAFKDTVAEAEKVIRAMEEIDDITDVGAMSATNQIGMGTSGSDNSIEIYAITKDKPKHTNEQLRKEIEKRTKDVNGEVKIATSAMDMSALGGSGINVQIKGRDLDVLQKIAGDVKEIVGSVPGTENVSDGMEDANDELRIVVNKDKATEKGLTVAQVYQELSGRIAEAKTATTLSTATNDYDVLVMDQKNESLTREDLKKLKIKVTDTSGKKKEVKLSDIASFEDAVSPQSINRSAQSRYMAVTAEIAEGGNIGLVSDKVSKQLKNYQTPEGYEIKMTGEDETINDAMKQLFKMLALAIAFMYLIMVAQFQSLKSPFIIMFTIPLAFTGGLMALWIAHMPISVISMVGFVMLSGIIVNNGIVFVDYTNQLMEGGLEKKQALLEAGRTRLRPIIMTALTTILGLCTMALGVGMGAEMVQPMAVVTIGGLIYGTLLTLLVVPCIYDIVHPRKRNKVGKRRKKRAKELSEDH